MRPSFFARIDRRRVPRRSPASPAIALRNSLQRELLATAAAYSDFFTLFIAAENNRQL